MTALPLPLLDTFLILLDRETAGRILAGLDNMEHYCRETGAPDLADLYLADAARLARALDRY